MFLVGGLGECQWLFQLLKQALPNMRSIVVAPEPRLAVMKGAVLMKWDPDLISHVCPAYSFSQRVYGKCRSPLTCSHFKDRDGLCNAVLVTQIVKVGFFVCVCPS